jgi:hypothetical protein
MCHRSDLWAKANQVEVQGSRLVFLFRARQELEIILAVEVDRFRGVVCVHDEEPASCLFPVREPYLEVIQKPGSDARVL